MGVMQMVTDASDAFAQRVAREIPAGTVFAGGRIDSAQQQLAAQEEAAVRGAGAKRRAEFVAGRTYARAALRALGVHVDVIPVGPSRAPVWPRTVVASITHSDTYCGVIAARSDAFRAIAIDAEPAVALDRELVDVVCAPVELRTRARHERETAVDLPKLLFSAKESVYKASFTLSGAFLDFKDVEIDLDPDARTFVGRLVTCAPEIAGVPRAISGGFIVADDHVVTWAAIHAGEGEPPSRSTSSTSFSK